MASTKKNRGIRRRALVAAMGLAIFAGHAAAQSAVGSIFGTGSAGADVIVENASTGTRRAVSADSQGRFNITQLAPGVYKVTSNGVTRTVEVRVGTGSQVLLTSDVDATLDVIEVRAGSINPIDTNSVESTTVFTAEQLSRIPVGREISAVALLAPGTVKGDTGLGGGQLASFGGASVAENGYYINGFDVTNIRNFIAYSTLPFEGLAQQQVKTGGYGAEYGRSLGGVISVVTKRGTNEWEGGASVYLNPDWGSAAGRDVLSRSPADIASGDIYSVYRSDNESSTFRYNLYGGGPILKDRLFFFGLIEGIDASGDSYGRITSQSTKDTTPTGMLKFDLNITDNHTVELTAIRDRTETRVRNFDNPVGQRYTGQHGDLRSEYDVTNGGDIYIAKYTGHITDNFTVAAQHGRLDNISGYRPPGDDEGCVWAYDSRANANTVTYTGCWGGPGFEIVRDPFFGPDKDVRSGSRLDLEWSLGDHFIRFGADRETFTSGAAGQSYSGGAYWRHYLVGATPRTVNGVVLAPGTSYARRRIYETTGGQYEVINEAMYLEDSWRINDNWLVYGGLRSESFENLNSAGETFVEASDQIAPRLGVSWDPTGEGNMKIFANAGRYFIPVAANTNIRMAAGELFIQDFFLTTGLNPATGLPTGQGGQIGSTAILGGDGSIPDSSTVAARNLEPMYQDEFIVGFQKEVAQGWTLGARGVYRDIKAGMDDFCGHQAFADYANDNGFSATFDPQSTNCVLINPGRDALLAVDWRGDGNPIETLIPARYFGVDEYKRSYTALEVFFEHQSDKFSVQGSYTWSRSYGNAEGYVNSSLEQDDAGITQDFDFPEFTDGARGYLPNDRRHVVKVFGDYRLADEWSVGGNVLIQSGRPVNCLGFAPVGNDEDSGTLAFYGSSSFYCVQPNSSVQLGSRGDRGRTPWLWSLDTSISYVPEWADDRLRLSLVVFNIFDRDSVTEYNEVSATGTATAFQYNANFLNDQNYQAPRSVRLSATWDF